MNLPSSRASALTPFGARHAPSHKRVRRLKDLRRMTALALAMALVFQILSLATKAHAALGTVGSGFTVTAGDLNFILKQIKIAEMHATTLTASNPCGTLLTQPADGIPDAEHVPD